MLLPYLDMGNLFMSSQTANNVYKLDVILNTALSVLCNIYKPYKLHRLDLYCRANLLSPKYPRQYFPLNTVHRLVQNEDVDIIILQRETRNNRAPEIVHCYQ